MGWRDCMSPEQVDEIDYLSVQTQIDKEKLMEEWANLVRTKQTVLSLHDWLRQQRN